VAYKDVKLQTPSVFRNKFLGKSALVISSGHSTSNILESKRKIRENFDVIIVVNYAFQYFDEIVDFHIVVEKTSKSTKNNIIHELLSKGDYRTDVPRIINWKGINLYDKRYNIFKTTRNNFDGSPNLRKYVCRGREGLLSGPKGTQGFSLGSVTLSAMHFAGILGVKDIYLIGSDFIFRDEFDHFYKDRMYRDGQSNVKSKANRHKIVDVEKNGKVYKTTQYFAESAEYMDSVVDGCFRKSGIEVFDFSDGLITKATRANIHDFLK
jgi:hypothetical protein